MLALRSRGDLGDATRVDFEELAPDIDTFLGQAAYLQLGFFETLSELIALTPELAQKESLSKAAGPTQNKHDSETMIRQPAFHAGKGNPMIRGYDHQGIFRRQIRQADAYPVRYLGRIQLGPVQAHGADGGRHGFRVDLERRP